MLAVLLPDGSAGTVPAAATDVFGEQPGQSGPVTVLSVDGVRRLRALLEVARSRGSGNRGTRRRAA
jgi:hypothetical protein